MKTAMIILNYNSAITTKRLLHDVKKYEIIDKIIIVDNNSSDKGGVNFFLSDEISEKVHLVKAPKNGGYSYGNNYGIKYLEFLGEEYDYIIISNPDIEVEEKAIEKCLKELEENEKVAVVAPRMINGKGKPIRRSSWKIRTPGIDMVNSTRLTQALFYWKFKKGEYSASDFETPKLKVEAVSGAFFIIKYKIFKEVGFFDEGTFLFYEEDILASKLKKMGYEECSLNTATFTHYESQTISSIMNYYNKMKLMQKSKMYYQKKYNNINLIQKIIFAILNFWKKVELLVETPIRRIISKIQNFDIVGIE